MGHSQQIHLSLVSTSTSVPLEPRYSQLLGYQDRVRDGPASGKRAPRENLLVLRNVKCGGNVSVEGIADLWVVKEEGTMGISDHDTTHE